MCVSQTLIAFDLPSGAFGQPRAFISHRLKKHTQPDGLRILVPNALIDPSITHSFIAQSTPVCPSRPSVYAMRLKLGELLDGLAGPGKHTEDVETDSLGERSALANDDLVTRLDTESGGYVRGEVLVALLVTGVLGDEVEVLAADDKGTWCLLAFAQPSCSFMRCHSVHRTRVFTYGASWWRRRYRSGYGHGSRPCR